jgi:hypothetical protein
MILKQKVIERFYVMSVRAKHEFSRFFVDYLLAVGVGVVAARGHLPLLLKGVVVQEYVPPLFFVHNLFF